MMSHLLMSAALAAAIVAAPIQSLAQTRLSVEGALPAFTGATTWLNSGPLSPQGLRGKVVLVDFWTYTCINWQRTLPHLRAWADKYRSKGLVVFGIHTPEFGFDRGRP